MSRLPFTEFDGFSWMQRHRLVCGWTPSGLAWLGSDGSLKQEEALPGLQALLENRPRGAVVDVIASNDVAVHWLQTPPRSLQSLQELRTIAGLRSAHLFGGQAADWLVAGDWSINRPFACAALPARGAALLSQKAAEMGAVLRWHTAWAVIHEGATEQAGAWRAVRSESRLVIWHQTASHLGALLTVAAPPGSSELDDLALVKTMAQLQGHAVDGPSLRVTDMRDAAAQAALYRMLEKASTQTRLVFLPTRASLAGTRRRTTRAGFALAAITTVALAAIFFDVRENDASLQRLAAIAETAVPARPAPSPTKQPNARELAAWNETIRQLNTPWPALLSALEAATPADIALVSIEPDARSRSVRIVAEAKGLDTLLQYAQGLQDRAPITTVMPTRHETNEQDANRPVRLALQLGLGEPQPVEPQKQGDSR